MGGIQVRSGKTLQRRGVASLEEEQAWSLAYSPSRVEPDKYWAIEDRVMTKGVDRNVTVTVGDVEEVEQKEEYYRLQFKRPPPPPPVPPKSETPR